MKQLNSISDLKSFSIALQKNLASQDIDVKHSLMLESIAKAMNYNDWNTLSAVLSKTDKLDVNQLSWDKKIHIHVDNGDYDFFYHFDHQLMKIQTSFFGYSKNIHYYYLPLSIITLVKEKLISFSKVNHNQYLMMEFLKKIHLIEIEDLKIGFKGEEFIISNSHSLISINLIYNKILLQKFIEFFNMLSSNNTIVQEPFLYSLTPLLLSSMAMRYQHNFGLLEEKEKQSLLTDMENLYYLYKNGLNDDEISKISCINIVSIRQIREETNGNGFYKPKIS